MKYKINSDVPIRFFMNENVHVEKSAFKELEEFLKITDTIENLKKHAGFESISVEEMEVSISPDFHKGSGIPIGTSIKTNNFVIPAAVGNDINCGMRLYKTNLTVEQIQEHYPKIEKNVRHVFFEGGRNIPMAKKHRESLLKEGLIGLHESSRDLKGKGLWAYYDRNKQEQELNYIEGMGSYITDQAFGFDNYLGSDELSYDMQIANLGGGNHFMELLSINSIKDKSIARLWNVKEGQVVIMIHTGSLSIGHQSNAFIKDILRNIYPKGLKQPDNGLMLIPNSEHYKKEWDLYWSLLNNAGNFAFANRMLLGLMIYKSISDELGEFEFELLHDSPHNYIWEDMVDGQKSFIHRKGSSVAKSSEQMKGTPFELTGQPVMLPGSMGGKSYLLSGLGNRESLYSSSHGAGRSKSRGAALKVDDTLFREFIEKFKIITPIDPKRHDLRSRQDILKKWEEELKKEAPFAYKNISPIIETHEDFGVANVVAEMSPIFTIKG